VNVVINIYTVSGFIVQAFAVMPKSSYEEFSGAEIRTDILPLYVRESLIPGHLRCFLAPAIGCEADRFDKLGRGKHPGRSMPSIFDPIKQSRYRRCINWVKSLLFVPVIENHI
jgi:hypothetical protein